MEYAKEHIKTIVIFLVLALSAGGIVVLDNPQTPTSSQSSPVPTENPVVGDTSESRVKAGTITITFPPKPTDIPQIPTLSKPLTCSQSLAVDILVDTSNSMKDPRNNPRIDTMKKALQSFFANLPDDTLIAGQKFDNQARHIITPTILSEGRENIKDVIRDLRPAGEGGTNIREGLEKAKKIIENSVSQYPNKKWHIILLTDGSPYPSYEHGEEVAKDLKSNGIEIITIGLDIEADKRMTEDEIREYLTELASSSSDFYDATQDDLSAVYNTLSQTLCQ